ncbi:hypothetical protein K458DRAFT_432474 [Lentithecium fluviatile CBS 122367]|uniref:Uncharacterized protein n=1 Tax=Lentithecium fluviatile CBS 122367 TaxID=1168545 RepID=A0A6G1IXW5_9PLEO|nr:hypothetical protein K458DRAFT_432474 [Lentithecium fluviatile CBS 122367]
MCTQRKRFPIKHISPPDTYFPSNLKSSEADAASSGISNAISLSKLHSWFHYPLLFVMAIAARLITIAFIITPATLSVAVQENIADVTLNVPQTDFNNLNEPLSWMWR